MADGDIRQRDRRPPFERIYREHYAFVFRCVSRFGVHSGVEDAVQEVFITAHRRLHTFAGRGSVRAWLAGIARRVAFRSRRGDQRRSRRYELLRAIPPEGPDLERSLQRKEAARCLDAFLDELDENKRVAFVLCELESLTGREVAERLGINQNTVHARLRAARKEFARACEQYGMDLTPAHRETKPPPGAAKRGWIALVSTSKGLVPATLFGAQAKLLAATLAVGTGGLVAADQLLPDPGETAATPHRVARPPMRARPSPAPSSSHAPEPQPTPPAEPPAAAEVTPVEPPPQPKIEKRKPERRPDPAPSDGLSTAELGLLAQAQRAFRKRQWPAAAATARKLLHDHPRTTLARDAEAILLKALCRAGSNAPQQASKHLSATERKAILTKHCAENEATPR